MKPPFTAPPELSGNGLHLRFPDVGDAEQFARHISDPRVHLQTGSLHADYTIDDAIGFIAGLGTRRVSATDYVYAITVPEAPQAILGVVGLHRRQPALPWELGYWIAPDAWGRTVATRAGGLMLNLLTDGIGERLAVAKVNVDNPASIRVLRKLDFMPAGRGKSFSRGRNAWSPVIEMAWIAPGA